MQMLRPEPSRPGRIFRSTSKLNSLFGEILLMLSPLLFLWPISIGVTHHFASQIANHPYDETLAAEVRIIVGLIRQVEGKVVVDLPESARALLHADERDVAYYQVIAPSGELVAGDREIPRAPPPDQADAAEVRFHSAHINEEEVRIAYAYAKLAGLPSPVLVQVGETIRKREHLAAQIISGVILPQLAIVPLAVVLVYFGLTRGIAPLTRLQRHIRHRRPGDLAPIDIQSVPEEVRPVIAAFNEMMARLEENLQAQQRFIADAAHQMRTPLTGLKMQTDLAMHETDPEQLRESLTRIAESTDRAAHLINQLLSLARAEASFEKLYVVETVSLDAVVREVALELFPRAQAKQIDLGVESGEHELLVEGNPVLLREMVKNLVDNAVKYTPRGGSVTARTRFAGSPILEVEDTGPGIPDADRERVFERFYRVLGSGVDGSGLGLPIVREIAELHRATVTLDANPGGQGTLARVVFPRSHLQPPPLVQGDHDALQ